VAGGVRLLELLENDLEAVAGAGALGLFALSPPRKYPIPSMSSSVVRAMAGKELEQLQAEMALLVQRPHLAIHPSLSLPAVAGAVKARPLVGLPGFPVLAGEAAEAPVMALLAQALRLFLVAIPGTALR
jgi:hypothetical protein